MHRSFSATLALAVTLLACGVFAQATDSQKAEAKKHFDAGKALMKVEDFAGAASEFEESVRLYPTRNGLFNLANSYKGAGLYEEALDAYRRLETEFGSQLDDEASAKMKEDVRDIQALIAWVTVEVSQDGATVTVDGVERGTSPLGKPLLLGAGSHAIEVALEGYETFSEEISILAGDRKTVSIWMVALPEPEEDTSAGEEAVPPPRVVPEPEGRSGLFKGGVATLTIGAAVTLAGGVTGYLALRKGNTLENECPSGECPPELHDEMRDMDDLAVTTNVLLGVGGALVLSGAVMLIVDAKRSGEDEADASVEVSLAPILGPSSAGASIAGRF